MKIYISRIFAVGLCAYLRQASLSIDRSFGQFSKLQAYYGQAKENKPSDVANKINTLVAENADRSTNIQFSKKLILPALWNWVVRRTIALHTSDMNNIAKALNDLSVSVENDILDRESLVALRLELAYASQFLSDRIFSAKCRKYIERVEHFNQNEKLTTLSIPEICGNSDWLKN